MSHVSTLMWLTIALCFNFSLALGLGVVGSILKSPYAVTVALRLFICEQICVMASELVSVTYGLYFVFGPRDLVMMKRVEEASPRWDLMLYWLVIGISILAVIMIFTFSMQVCSIVFAKRLIDQANKKLQEERSGNMINLTPLHRNEQINGVPINFIPIQEINSEPIKYTLVQNPTGNYLAGNFGQVNY